MALTLRDCLLLADTIVPAWRQFVAMPRDAPEDIAVFLCHGIQLQHVPTSAAAQAATPEHRRKWSCPKCRRELTPIDRRTDIEKLFDEGDVVAVFKIVKAVGVNEGWYDPSEELAGARLQRALHYYADGCQRLRDMGLGVDV